MHTGVKVGIALLVLTVRLWGKLGGIRNLFKGSSGEGLGLASTIGCTLGGIFLLYYLFEKVMKPMSWRAKWAKKGVALCPNWMPVIGNYKALSIVTNKAKGTAEPNQNAYALLGKEFFCDKDGIFEPIVAVNAPFGDHLQINCSDVAEQIFEQQERCFDVNNAMSRINTGFTTESWVYALESKAKRRRFKGFMSVFHGENFGFIFDLTKNVTGKKLAQIQESANDKDTNLTMNLTNEVLSCTGEIVLKMIFSNDVIDADKFLMVQQWANGKQKAMPFTTAFSSVYAKSHQKLGSFLRHLLIGNYMDYDLDSAEKENMRNKQEIVAFVRNKIKEVKEHRKTKPIVIERDHISYVDGMLADKAIRDDEDAMVAECLSAYLHLGVFTGATIAHGLYHIIKDPKVTKKCLGEIAHHFGPNLTAD